MEKQKLKKSKVYAYLPLYLAVKKPGRQPEGGTPPEYITTVIKENLPFTNISVGDVFITKKRDTVKELLDNEFDIKVEQVKYSIVDASCIVILEKMVFEKKEDLDEFLKNKKNVK